MYKLLFYNFYLFSKYLKKVFPSHPNENVKYASVLMLSFFETLNIISIRKFFQPIDDTNLRNFEFIFFLVITSGVNYLLLAKGDKLNLLIKAVSLKSRRELSQGKFLMVFYMLLTFLCLWIAFHKA